MIIKSMSRKNPSFGKLLAYFSEADQPGKPFGHNLSANVFDTEAVRQEFLENYRYLPPRKNGNVLYHEVLSFSDLDRPKVTQEIIENLTHKYLDLRAPFALSYAQAHFQETGCAHVHVMISANNRGSHRRVSLSRAAFAQVKRQLEKYQKAKYPFLEHSVVFDSSKRRQTRVRQTRRESERERRLLKVGRREPSRKEQLRDLIGEEISRVNSLEALNLRLKLMGLQMYQHGKLFCVLDHVGNPTSSAAGRRYRLKTLGFDEVLNRAIDQWRVSSKRLKAFEELDLRRAEHLWRAQGYRDQIGDVMALNASELSPLERRRLEQVRTWRKAQKQRKQEPPEISP